MFAIGEIIKDALKNAFENLPEDTKQQIGQFGEIALGVKTQLDRIEAQNLLIMSHLGVTVETHSTEETDARTGIRKSIAAN